MQKKNCKKKIFFSYKKEEKGKESCLWGCY